MVSLWNIAYMYNRGGCFGSIFSAMQSSLKKHSWLQVFCFLVPDKIFIIHLMQLKWISPFSILEFVDECLNWIFTCFFFFSYGYCFSFYFKYTKWFLQAYEFLNKRIMTWVKWITYPVYFRHLEIRNTVSYNLPGIVLGIFF